MSRRRFLSSSIYSSSLYYRQQQQRHSVFSSFFPQQQQQERRLSTPFVFQKQPLRLLQQQQQEEKRFIMSSTTTKDDDNNTTKMKRIQEGSTIMIYPSSQDMNVFYNPVQVQNRDLSILMITIYGERKAIRYAMKQKKKEMNKNNNTLSQTERDEKLKKYKETLNGTKLVSVQNGLTILDALAASGLRSIRYWKEIPNVKHITINDLEYAAVQRAYQNICMNELKDDLIIPERTKTTNNGDSKHHHHHHHERGIRIQQGDAMHELYMSRKRPVQLVQQQQQQDDEESTTAIHQQQQSSSFKEPWDVIDLDPYGSASPFLDGAVQAVHEDGGLLNITCTDMRVLGGSLGIETCFGRYGGCIPFGSHGNGYLQEAAIRHLLYSLSITASKYGRSIHPLCCVGMDFYIRCFVEIRQDKQAVTQLSTQIGHVYQSTQCSSFYTMTHASKVTNNNNNNKRKTKLQPSRLPSSTCPETGGSMKMGGPMWLGPIHDQEFVDEALDRLQDDESSTTSPNLQLLKTRKRLIGLLTSVSEELKNVPLYYLIPDLCHSLGCNAPPMKQFRAALYNAGYDVSGYHKNPNAIKTNAPDFVVWDIMREWCKLNPPASKGMSKKKMKKLQRKKEREEKRRKQQEEEQQKASSSGSSGTEGKMEIDNDQKKNESTTAVAAASAADDSKDKNGDNDDDTTTKNDATSTTSTLDSSPSSFVSISEKILSKPMQTKIDFTISSSQQQQQQNKKKKKIARFPQNPQAYWGPKKAAIKSGTKRKEPSESTTTTTNTTEETTKQEMNDETMMKPSEAKKQNTTTTTTDETMKGT